MTLSIEAVSVLRVLFRFRGRPASGDELMERIFATTSEMPLDAPKVCAAVRELASHDLVIIDPRGKPDPGYDFAMVAITDSGREYLTG
jgi:DNA-binding PadR family transcriptional regulator